MNILIVLLPLNSVCILVAECKIINRTDRNAFLFFGVACDSLDRCEHLVHLVIVHLTGGRLLRADHIDPVRVVLEELGSDHIVLLLNLRHLERMQ